MTLMYGALKACKGKNYLEAIDCYEKALEINPEWGHMDRWLHTL